MGYEPVAYTRTGISVCRMQKIVLKRGKETCGAEVKDFVYVKANETAQTVLVTHHLFLVESFKQCEGFGRVAFIDSNTAVVLGKIIKVDWAEDPQVMRISRIANPSFTGSIKTTNDSQILLAQFALITKLLVQSMGSCRQV